MLTVQKITYKVIDQTGKVYETYNDAPKNSLLFAYNGPAWGVMENGKVKFTLDCQGKPVFHVYSTKKAATQDADYYNRKEN